MTREECLRIIKEKNYKDNGFFKETANSTEYSVSIVKEGTRYKVYSTVERASVRGLHYFDNESDALEKYLVFLKMQDDMFRKWREDAEKGIF